MKQILLLFLAFALLCPLNTGYAAQDPTITVSQGEAVPGGQVSLAVSLSENPGIVGMTLNFDYDRQRLELLEIQGSGLGGTWYTATAAAWASSSGDSTYNGSFLTLTFRVREDAQPGFAPVSVKLESGDICNNALEPVDFAVVSGGVEVAAHGLTGTIASWNSLCDAAAALYASEKTDGEIEQDIRGGGKNALYAADTAAAEGGQQFSFRNLKAGSYKLAIYKPGGYVVKIRPVEIEGTVDLGVVKLWLYGDVVYDGVIQESDAQQLQRYIVGEPSVFGSGSPEDEADRLKAANVGIFSDGDGELESGDVLQIRRYIAGLPSVFSLIP